MASYKTITGSIFDDKGTWSVRARVYDPETGKTRHRSKSTGYKVKSNTKRKAEQAAKDILHNWEKEAISKIVSENPSLADYIQKWI